MKLKIKFDRELITMSVVAFVIALVSIEFIFRSNEEEPTIPHLGMYEEFCPHPDFFVGKKDDPYFRMEPELIRRYARRGFEQMFVIGGSATEAYNLSEHEQWPFMLTENIQQKNLKIQFVNIAKSASTSFQHVKDIKMVCDTFPDTRGIIVQMGVADMLFAISGRDYSDLSGSIFQHSAIFRDRSLIVDVEDREVRNRYIDYSPMGFISRREKRKNAPKTDVLPDLEDALDDYEDNILTMIEESDRIGKKIIFVTQPTLWHADMSEEEEQFLWTGGIFESDAYDPDMYYSPEALAGAISAFNDRLIKTCNEHKVEVLDLASKIPKEKTLFIDGYHLKESGQYLSANIMLENLAF